MSTRGLRAITVVAVVGAFLVAAPAAGAYIYWADYGGLTGGGTTIGRANLDGTAVERSFNAAANSPGPVLGDGTHVYWANDGGGSYSIARANSDGTGVNQSFIQTTTPIEGFAADSSYIYWTDGQQWIGRANLDGTGTPNPHFINMTTSYPPFGIAVNSGILYVGTNLRVMRVAADGSGSPATFTSLTGAGALPLSIAIAGGYVYWAEFDTGAPSGTVGRIALNGAGLNESYVPALSYPTGVASDGTYLYWVDNSTGSIGRALIGSPTPTNIQSSFITDPSGPWGIAVDSQVDPTATSISCSPSTVATGDPSVCTALVSDAASSETPTGTVVFSGAGVFFPGGNSCTLTAHPGGGASCTVGAESGTAGTQSVSASYSGDPTHTASGGGGQFCAGGASVCGGTSGGGATTGGGGGGTPITTSQRCKVPKLEGKTLTQARRMLAAAHCALGKVISPRAKKRRKPALVVGRQSPGAGAVLASGAKVSLTLVVKPPPRKKPRHR